MPSKRHETYVVYMVLSVLLKGDYKIHYSCGPTQKRSSPDAMPLCKDVDLSAKLVLRLLQDSMSALIAPQTPPVFCGHSHLALQREQAKRN